MYYKLSQGCKTSQEYNNMSSIPQACHHMSQHLPRPSGCWLPSPDTNPFFQLRCDAPNGSQRQFPRTSKASTFLVNFCMLVVTSNGCQPKNSGILPPKMDGENHGSKPYEQMGWFGGVKHPLFLVQHLKSPLFGSTFRTKRYRQLVGFFSGWTHQPRFFRKNMCYARSKVKLDSISTKRGWDKFQKYLGFHHLVSVFLLIFDGKNDISSWVG